MDLELPLRRTPPWRGLERDVDVVIGTLSKALGSYGAFACCSQELG
jgi:7-keto-8-aminopelargonate synthetase-like enzyme